MEYGDTEFIRMKELYGGRGQKAKDIPEKDREQAYEYFKIVIDNLCGKMDKLRSTREAMEEKSADDATITGQDISSVDKRISSLKKQIDSLLTTRKILCRYLYSPDKGKDVQEKEEHTYVNTGKTYRSKTKTVWEEKAAKRKAANRAVIGAFMADNGLMHMDMKNVPMHDINFDEKSGRIYDNTASGTVIGTFSVGEDGRYTDIKPYRNVIEQITGAEKEALKEVSEKEGIRAGDLTLVFRRGSADIKAAGGEGKIKTVKFNRIPVKTRGFRFEEQEDKVIAKARTGMEKIAGKLMEPAEVLLDAADRSQKERALSDEALAEDAGRKAEKEMALAAEAELAKEKALDNMRYTYDGDEFDRENFRKRLIMALEPVTKMLGIRAADYIIQQETDGSGLIKAPGKHGEITVGEITGDLEGRIYTEEQIRQQEDTLEKADIIAGRPLFVKPEETKAFRLEYDRAGSYFATFDYNGKMSLNGEVPHSIDVEGKRKENLEQSMEHFARISGVDKKDLVFVDGCSYVVTTDGKAVGILGNDGQVIADEETINENREMIEEAERTGKTMTEIDYESGLEPAPGQENDRDIDEMADEYAAMMQEAEDARNSILDEMTQPYDGYEEVR